jgi:membrane associated rhomboid family serine protease
MTSPPALPSDHRGEQLIRSIKDHLLLLFGIVAIAWGLEIADTLLFGFLDRFGIQPRSISGLSGIVTAPFLHLGFGHLVSNTLPFLILGGVVLIGGRSVFIRASVFIIAIGGMMLWTLGPKATNHLGASLLIFGYLGFLLARGIFERSGFWILVSVFTLILYGGMLGGVLPGQPGISWQGHLFGFVAGVISARVMFTRDQGEAISG